jgi:hypothetical protein
VLAVVAVGALSVGSFFAGEHHQARKMVTLANDEYSTPIPAGAISVLSDGVTQESWCRDHPSTGWETALNHAPKGFVPITGYCDIGGDAHFFWKVNPFEYAVPTEQSNQPRNEWMDTTRDVVLEHVRKRSERKGLVLVRG